LSLCSKHVDTSPPRARRTSTCTTATTCCAVDGAASARFQGRGAFWHPSVRRRSRRCNRRFRTDHFALPGLLANAKSANTARHGGVTQVQITPVATGQRAVVAHLHLPSGRSADHVAWRLRFFATITQKQMACEPQPSHKHVIGFRALLPRTPRFRVKILAPQSLNHGLDVQKNSGPPLGTARHAAPRGFVITCVAQSLLNSHPCRMGCLVACEVPVPKCPLRERLLKERCPGLAWRAPSRRSLLRGGPWDRLGLGGRTRICRTSDGHRRLLRS
jgi:hypothetical protein